MRKIITTFLSCSFAIAVFGQGISLNWSTPISVADGSTYGTTWPRIALTDNNVPVVMWGNTSDTRIYVSRLNGASFTTPVNVVPTGLDAFVANWAGPDMGAWGDSVFVTFKSTPTVPGKVYIARSTDGGLTFTDTIRVENIGNDVSRFPALDVAAGGNPVVTFMRFDSTFGDARYEVARSWDGGQTFSPAVGGSNAAPGDVCDCCPTDIHVEGNTHLLPFRNNDSNIRDTWVAVSNNSGASFDTIVRVDYSNWNIMACPSQGSDVTLSGDTIVTVWATGEFGPYQVWLTAMDINTYTIAYSQRLETIVSGGQQVARIVSRGDTLGAIWEDGRSGDLDCYFAYSVDGPAGLLSGGQNAVALTSGSQENPDVAFADGVFHIVYRDAANNEVVYRTATIDAPTSVDEVLLNDVLIYPIPASEFVKLELPEEPEKPVSIKLTDLHGKLIYSTISKEKSAVIDCRDMARGLYILHLANETIIRSRKLILD